MFLSRFLKYILLLQANLKYFELQTKYCGVMFCVILSRPGKLKQLTVSDLRNLQYHLMPDLSLLLGHKNIWL